MRRGLRCPESAAAQRRLQLFDALKQGLRLGGKPWITEPDQRHLQLGAPLGRTGHPGQCILKHLDRVEDPLH